MSSMELSPSGFPTPVPPGPVTTAELGALLKQAARGDDQAFGAFYDATSSRAFGLALRVVRNPAQAEEVVQEGYLEVWRTATRFDPDQGSAISWLLTTVHHRAVDRVRFAEAATRRDENYHHQNHTVPHDSTADEAHASFEARRVRGALRTLTPIQREALELAYFGGYTHTEVAAMLDLPIGTAKSRIRDGLIRLREALEAGRTPRGAA
ncbi:ECF RNA polymerase sigma factor SigK [Nocardioides sp. AX2bis]|nr:ECF RNA polymerase sigma factor SigK [Nocardioides sp. AX2bis]